MNQRVGYIWGGRRAVRDPCPVRCNCDRRTGCRHVFRGGGRRPARLSAVPRIVYAAKTFGEAERRLANERFDLVILDLMLPDGVVEDLLPRLKGPGRSPTPVIVFYSKEVSRETADGIRAALVKSQTSNDALLQVIHLAVEKGKEVAEPLS